MKAFWQGNFLSSESSQQSLPVVGSYIYNLDLQQMCVCTYLTCVQIYCTVGRWRVCFKQVKHSPHPVEHFGNILSEYATGQSLLYFIVVAYSLFKALTKKKIFRSFLIEWSLVDRTAYSIVVSKETDVCGEFPVTAIWFLQTDIVPH